MQQEFTLNNGVKIPAIGLGTWQSKGIDCCNAVTWALECGYRHIDTAHIYKNHDQVAQGILNARVNRSSIFITSKLPPYDQGYDAAIKCFENSLKELQTNYIDCFLIHWPGTANVKSNSAKNIENRKQSWFALEKLYREGKVKSIGVSNYYENHLTDLLSYCSVKPVINQCEFHPILCKKELLEFCKANQIQFEAYSSLGVGKLLTDNVITSVAAQVSAKYNLTITPANVLLKWGLQHDAIVLPKSVKKDRVESNFLPLLQDWKLSNQQMDSIDALNTNTHLCWDPTQVV